MSQTEDFGQNKSKETKLRERDRGRAPARSAPWRRRPAALFPPHGPGGRGAAVGAKRRPAAATAGSGGSRGSPQPSGEGKREEGARANQSHRPKGEAARRRRRPSVWRPLTAEAAGEPAALAGEPASFAAPSSSFPAPAAAEGLLWAQCGPGRRWREGKWRTGRGRRRVPAGGESEGRPWRPHSAPGREDCPARLEVGFIRTRCNKVSYGWLFPGPAGKGWRRGGGNLHCRVVLFGSPWVSVFTAFLGEKCYLRGHG